MTPNSRTPTTRSRPDPHYVSESSHDDTRDQRTGRPDPGSPRHRASQSPYAACMDNLSWRKITVRTYPHMRYPTDRSSANRTNPANHRARMPRHTQHDRPTSDKSDHTAKSPVTHAATYTTRQIVYQLFPTTPPLHPTDQSHCAYVTPRMPTHTSSL